MSNLCEDMLDIVCCPNCQGDLEKDNSKLICKSCLASFREKEGILILISKEFEEELRN